MSDNQSEASSYFSSTTARVLHKCFTPRTQHMIDLFFTIHFYLDPSGSLRDPAEARCPQCNMLLACQADLAEHVSTVHTFAARRGSRAFKMVRKKVMQRYQDGLPKVQLRGGIDLRNAYMKTWVGMTFTADGGQEDHVRERLLWAGTEFGRQRKMLTSSRLLRPVKVSAYKGAVLINGTFGCETITLTSNIGGSEEVHHVQREVPVGDNGAVVCSRADKANIRHNGLDLLAQSALAWQGT